MAGASGPAGPVLAGPIFRRLRGVGFYNIAIRIVRSKDALLRSNRRRNGPEKKCCWKLQNIDSPLLGTVY